MILYDLVMDEIKVAWVPYNLPDWKRDEEAKRILNSLPHSDFLDRISWKLDKILEEKNVSTQ